MESLGFLRDVLPFKFRGICTSVTGKAKDVLLDKKRSVPSRFHRSSDVLSGENRLFRQRGARFLGIADKRGLCVPLAAALTMPKGAATQP